MEHEDSQTRTLETIADSLVEIERMMRVITQPLVSTTLKNTLNSPEKKVYECMDGNNTVSVIQEKTKVNSRYISEWGQEWEKIGIVESDDKSYYRARRKKIYDLSLFGFIKNEISTK